MGDSFRSFGFVACFALAAAGCSPKLPAEVNKAALESAMSAAVGDIGACVILVRKSDGAALWRHGSYDACHAKLPTCTASGPASASSRVREAAAGGLVTASCASDTPGMSVAWVIGPAGKPSSGLAYVALMQSADERALPGRELAIRVQGAFANSRL